MLATIARISSATGFSAEQPCQLTSCSRPCLPAPPLLQVIEELFAYWNLEDADETLEELEDALIVSGSQLRHASACLATALLRDQPSKLLGPPLACASAPHPTPAPLPSHPHQPPPTPAATRQMSDFGPKTAFKIVDGIRDKVGSSRLRGSVPLLAPKACAHWERRSVPTVMADRAQHWVARAMGACR